MNSNGAEIKEATSNISVHLTKPQEPIKSKNDLEKTINATVLQQEDSDDDIVEGPFVDARSKPSKRQRMKTLASVAKDAPRKLAKRVDVLPEYDQEMDIDGESIPGITDNPAFNTGQLLRKDRQRHRASTSKSLHSMRRIAGFVAHPKDAAKSQAAAKIPATEHNYLTPETDAQLLSAHEDLARVANSRGSTSDNEEDYQQHVQRIKAVEADRDRMRTAWMTAKHVKRVKVVPRRHITYPTIDEHRNNATSNVWVGRYLGHMLLYLSQDFTTQYIDDSEDVPFKRAALIHHLERFFVATGPWQAWLINVRKIYFWEDPWLTGRWFVLYLFLLKTGYIMTFFYSYIVYIVLKNRYTKQSVKALRESQDRAMDRGAQVVKLSELVNRHGDEQWLDPLLDHMGPLLQQQLGDLADYLEILVNFYDWRAPRATKASLIFWTSCALASALCSTEYATKVFFFVCGFWFFWSRPIASRYPKYRKVVSIFRWIYWDIPTHAELAFAQLRAQAQESREAMVEQEIEDYVATEKLAHSSQTPLSNGSAPRMQTEDGFKADSDFKDSDSSSDTNPSDSSYDNSESETSTSSSPEIRAVLRQKDIIAFQGQWQSITGRLVVHTKGLRFIRSKFLPRSLLNNANPSGGSQVDDEYELWSRSFAELVEMHKTSSAAKRRPPMTRMTPPHGMHLTWADGTFDHVLQMRKRDEAFNTIIGFSRLRWMQLQPISEDLSKSKQHEFVGGDRANEHIQTKETASGNDVDVKDFFQQ